MANEIKSLSEKISKSCTLHVLEVEEAVKRLKEEISKDGQELVTEDIIDEIFGDKLNGNRI